jgi:hypothetical protein
VNALEVFQRLGDPLAALRLTCGHVGRIEPGCAAASALAGARHDGGQARRGWRAPDRFFATGTSQN